jgi:hypothetical protein
MAIDREKMDFIRFIIDATKDGELAKRFLSQKKASDVHEFFKKEGYIDIPLEDCEGILDASIGGHGKGINGKGEPVIVDPVIQSY